MTLSASWTVFCDECSAWHSEQPSKREAIADAIASGFVRTHKDGERGYWWLCPTDNPALCGSYSGAHVQTWCTLKPDHEGEHRW